MRLGVELSIFVAQSMFLTCDDIHIICGSGISYEEKQEVSFVMIVPCWKG